jgi:5-(carboxyamino)imidazole ribonucleotide synthase
VTSRFPILGILGGGQLGRMTALAAIPLGIGVRFWVEEGEDAGPVAAFGDVVLGRRDDPDALRRFADGLAAVTADSEWAPADLLADAVAGMAGAPAIWPSPDTLYQIRHKGRQRDLLAEANLPQPPLARCATPGEMRAAAERFGFPIVAKRYEGSYDGYGNATCRSADDLDQAWDRLAADDGLLVEAFVDFRRELSVLVARRPGGDHVTYPVAHTEQRDHRCHAVVVPAPDLSAEVEAEARRVALGAAEAVGAVGLLAVELFETAGGEVLINELAPRPHNTGHYSIEGSVTSQFANHARAVLDLPLGDPGLRAPSAVMINVLGQSERPTAADGLQRALAVPGAGVHLYGKGEERPRRKMGHVTALGDYPDEARARAERAARLLLPA